MNPFSALTRVRHGDRGGLGALHGTPWIAHVTLAWCLSACASPGPGSGGGSAPPTAPPSGPVPAVPIPPPPAVSGFLTQVTAMDFNVVPARPTTTAATLSLYSGIPRTVTLTLLGENRVLTQELAAGVPAAVELGGLAPDRTYRYRVDGPALSYAGQFRTAKSPGSPFRFVMQADSHLDANSDPAVYTNTLRNMLADSADFLMDLGDTFMSDKYPAFEDAAGHYYAQRHYFGLAGTQLALFLVQGNHDAEDGWLSANAAWAAGQRLKYFPPVVANAFYRTTPALPLPRNYFAFRWGDALFVALDPYRFTVNKPGSNGSPWGWTLGREQYDWLAALLRANTAPYTFVFLHHLVGGNGPEARGGAEASRFFEWGGFNLDGTPGFATQRPGWPLPIHDLLVQHGVAAVFHGHDHLYVNQVRDGIRYHEVPQPSFARENATASAADYGYLSGVLLGSSGHIRVSVTPAKAVVEYVRSRVGTGNGVVADAYDILPRRP